MKITDVLINYLYETNYDDIPEEVISAAVLHFADYIGVLIAGSSIDFISDLLEIFKGENSLDECSVAVFGESLPIVNAAIVNTAMARAHDIDDVHEEAVAHIGVGVIPAVLAAAETRKISGKEALTAIALGYDIAARFCLGALDPPGKSGMNIGYHAATLVSSMIFGKLVGLDREQVSNAAGIAFCEMSGTDQCLLEGTPMVSIQQGLSCGKGIRAAQLAKGGISGPKNIIEGKFGYFNTYQHGKYDIEKIRKDIGTLYHGLKISTKLYPCCKFAHSAIEGCFKICDGKKFESTGIEEVEVRLTQQAYTFICDPLEDKMKPKNIVDAKFSLPYILATAIRKANVWIDDFSKEEISNKKTLELCRKIKPVIDEKIEKENSNIIGPSEVIIKFADGTEKSALVKYVRGHPENPLGTDMIKQKLNRCIESAKRQFSEKERATLIQQLLEIKTAKDMSILINLIG